MAQYITDERIAEIRQEHPYLSFLRLSTETRFGVIQNETAKTILVFDFEQIKSDEAKNRFLNYADQWWWESNRSIPLDSFIGPDFDEFLSVLSVIPKKALQEEIIGSSFCLQELYMKRIKKRRIDILSRQAA